MTRAVAPAFAMAEGVRTNCQSPLETRRLWPSRDQQLRLRCEAKKAWCRALSPPEKLVSSAIGLTSASRNRKFESIPLQRGVACEPDFLAATVPASDR
jgi:hypothetical protein